MKVLICAAGSGGHIYPALSLADKLRQVSDQIEIIFISNNKAIAQDIFKKKQYRVNAVDFVSPYRAKNADLLKFCLKNLGFLLKFNKEAWKVFFLLKKEKPDIVIGFGGVTSIAAVCLAKVMGIPSMIHEQNIVPGLANRLLGKISDIVAVGFEQSSRYFRPRVVFTGNPIRPELKKISKTDACSRLGLSENKFTIFVFGGSQGSEFINNSFIKSVEILSAELKDGLQVIHATGPKQSEQITDFYKRNQISAKVFSYCENMSFAYSAADLVIGRAGAGTINEVCYFGKPAVFIPYLYAGAHQRTNAEFMQENQAACMIGENDLCVHHLQKDISRLISQPDILSNMAKKSSELFVSGAAEKLADLALESIGNKIHSN
jgi:UDP-N-acetylglucosamine--N-acetylmuramyl-(pentapeptide) pyrophosphoryl-undecaprenol N-acetylglucosamine transferase